MNRCLEREREQAFPVPNSQQKVEKWNDSRCLERASISCSGLSAKVEAWNDNRCLERVSVSYAEHSSKIETKQGIRAMRAVASR